MSVRKVAAILAVGALTMLSVVTGSSPAWAAVPAPPVIDQSHTPWITTSHQESALHGSMGLGVDSVTVSVSSDDVSYRPLCTAVNPNPESKQVWSCSGTAFIGSLRLGLNYLRATATNSDGTSLPSAAIMITLIDKKDPEPPASTRPPTITSPADGLYTNDNTPTFAGTAEGEQFRVTTANGNQTLCGGTVTGPTWSCTANPGLADGSYEYHVTSGELRSASRTIHIDTLAPAPPTVNAFPGAIDNSPAPTIRGHSEAYATLRLLLDGAPAGCSAGEIRADHAGAWSCVLTAVLSQGTHELRATQTDRAGNTSRLSSPVPIVIRDSTPPAPPRVTSPIDSTSPTSIEALTNDSTPTITGTGEPGATINSPAAPCSRTVTVSPAGHWSCTLGSPLVPDGSFVLPFTQTDASGNTSAPARPQLKLTVDTTAPESFELLTPTGTFAEGVVLATTTNTRPLISGMGEHGATVRIYRDGSIPVACQEGPQRSGEGGFRCTPSAALSLGVHYFAFSQTDAAGNSNASPEVKLRLTVLAPPAPPAAPQGPHPVTPPATGHFGSLPTLAASWLLEFQVLGGSPAPGQNITIIGGDLPTGATVTAELHSTPVPLGTTVVRSDGTFRLNTVIPNTVVPGAHHYVVTVSPDGDTAQTVSVPVTIVAAKPATIPAPPPTVVLPPLHAPGAAIVHRDEPAAPNVLSWTLPTAQSVLIDPLVLGAAAASSLAFMFLVAFPAELLNSTIEENYERLFGRIPKLKLPWLARMRKSLKTKPLVGGLALTTLAALIFSFADPHFGFDLASLRLFLACIIGMFVLGYVANAITGVILRKRWSIGSVIELQPLGLVVALVGVVLSRLLDFAPGLLIGLVLGLSLSASATLRDEARAVLIWAGIVLGLSIVCWVAYSLASGVVAPDTFGGALFDDTLVAVAVEGISGLVVGLLPIGYLDGASLFHRTKMLWTVSYLVALVAFFIIVVPSGQLWGDIQGPFWAWLTVLLVFAAVCVGIFLYFRFRREEAAREDAEDRNGDRVPARVAEE